MKHWRKGALASAVFRNGRNCRFLSDRDSPRRQYSEGGVVTKRRAGLFRDEAVARQSKPLPFEAIPGPKPSLPLIGTGWQYFVGGRYNLSDLHAASIDKFRRYGPVVKEEFQWRVPTVHLYDPADIETMFRKQGTKPVRPIIEIVKHYRERNPDKYDTAGLANSVGEEWLRLRQILAPVLMRLNSLEGLLLPMNDICDDFVRLLRQKRDPRSCRIENLQSLLYRLSMETVYMLCLEERLRCLEPKLQPNSRAHRMITSVKLLFESFHEIYFGLPLWKLYSTESYRKLGMAETIMYEAASQRIQEAMEKLRRCPGEVGQMPGILQKLLNTEGLSDKAIRVTIIDILSGGVFTVTNAFSFVLYHLSRNLRVQEKLYKQLKEVAPDGVITKERLDQLRYLKACIRESFRLTPTIPGIARILPDDIVASGYHIPAGTSVFSNFLVACQHPKMFPDPEEYRPERWLDGNEDIINPFALVPFGFGYRMCIGRRFAEMEMYISLAKIVHNFHLEETGQIISCKQAFIILPSHPISVIFKDRRLHSAHN